MSESSDPTAANVTGATSETPVDSALEEMPAKPRRRRRWPWVLGAVGVVAALFLFFIGSVTLLDYTESTEFCSMCHVMDPEHEAYMNSPHSRVECGTCHIGPGVIPAIQAKLAAVRYLWVYPTNSYERPIPSPIHSLRPTTVVCEQCHWPEKVYEDRLAMIPDYAPDEQNSLTQTQLLMKTGGGSAESGQGRGIHWHIENPVYYIATDEKRQDIPWVSAEYDGKVTEYLSTDSTLTQEDIANAEKRKMDCVDCHNRATHIFQNPEKSINEAMATGAISADLPYIKQYGAEVLGRKYATEEEAAAAIAGIAETYKTQNPDVFAAREADVTTAVTALQAIFDQNTFPFMNADWQSHPDNIGHENFPGCFRCHDGKHLSSDNQAIRLECNICHSIPVVADPGQPLPPITHPSVAEPDTHRSTTWLSEHRFKFDTTCESCHTVDNPGGSDNSSFCSNSACHATEWKYAGLNAPGVRELSAPPKVPSTGTPNPIPHPIGPTTDCKICHGPDKVKPYPENHTAFTPEMCGTCHQTTLKEGAAAPSTAPAVPHPLTGMGECTTCHGPGGAKPAPESHAAFTPDMCSTCHKATETAAAPGAAPTIPHAVEGMGECKNCHGPEGIKPAPANHAAFTPEMCTNCHQSNVAGVQPGAAPPIPHAVEGMAECKNCHGPEGIKPWPENHAAFTSDICANCHQPPQAAGAPAATSTPEDDESESESEGPPAIPHELAGRDNCLVCHSPDGGMKPAPANHAGRTVDTCQTCHKPQS
jgi:nitrate/TMAO reductase-like tetraheme cytochrome c subunit